MKKDQSIGNPTQEASLRRVILWSGGFDSTVLLHKLATQSSNVLALSISDHMGAPKALYRRQARARKNYLAFAKSQHINFDYQELQVTGSALMEADYWDKTQAYLREWQIFIPWILPFLRSGDALFLGYELYPDKYKIQRIIKLLKTYTEMAYWHKPPTVSIPERHSVDLPVKIPRNCVSSCTHPTSKVDCGKCDKCHYISDAWTVLPKGWARLGF